MCSLPLMWSWSFSDVTMFHLCSREAALWASLTFGGNHFTYYVPQRGRGTPMCPREESHCSSRLYRDCAFKTLGFEHRSCGAESDTEGTRLRSLRPTLHSNPAGLSISVFSSGILCACLDLNQGPTAYKTVALTAELQAPNCALAIRQSFDGQVFCVLVSCPSEARAHARAKEGATGAGMPTFTVHEREEDSQRTTGAQPV